MQHSSDITIRKKISLHAKILATILFISFGAYAISPVISAPSFLYILFPVTIWQRIAVTNGPTYQVVLSVIVLMAAAVTLFIWGHAYPRKGHYSMRLRIWFTLFGILLVYAWITPIFAHISAIFPPEPTRPIPPGVLPLDYKGRDLMMSQLVGTPPLYSMGFVISMGMTVLYAIECLWVHTLLTKANKAAVA